MVLTLTLKSFQNTTKNLLASGLKQIRINKKAMASTAIYEYETLSVTSEEDHVLHVQLNRPECLNAMNKMFWQEIRDCFKKVRNDKNCRVAIISGAGKGFSAGLDFNDMLDITSKVLSKEDVARKAKYLQSAIGQLQESFSAVDDCEKPVIAAIHGACFGAGVDLIAACDIRYCTEDAYFSIKEIDIGIAADVGTLQRLPKAVGNNSLLREYIYSCEKMNPQIAKEIGIVGKVFPSKDEMMQAANHLAGIIAHKSPVAVQGSKKALNFSRDHSVKEGLEFMTYWNMTMLQSEDVLKAAEATITKSEKHPMFSKL